MLLVLKLMHMDVPTAHTTLIVCGLKLNLSLRA